MNPLPRPHQPHAGLPDGNSRVAKAHATRGPNKKTKNNLLAIGSAAVLAIYLAGYYRTRSAAQRFEGDESGRRPSSSPTAVAAIPTVTPMPVSQPSVSANLPPKSVASVATVAATPAPAPATAPVPTPAPIPLPSVAPLPAAPVAAAKPMEVAATPAASAVTTPSAPTTTIGPAVAVVAAVVAPPTLPAGTLTNAAPAPSVPVLLAKWKDGKFSGWGSCRHGDIEATVEIKDGKIISAIVSTCWTRYSCDVIAKVIPQVVLRQSADIDTVSGATQSADAFYWAVTAALASAKPEPAKAI